MHYSWTVVLYPCTMGYVLRRHLRLARRFKTAKNFFLAKRTGKKCVPERRVVFSG